MRSWSYSHYETWTRCPLRYKCRYIDRLPEPPSVALERGKKIHEELARYIDRQTDAGPIFKHPQIRHLVEEVRAVDSKEIEQQWGFTREWKPTAWFGKDTWFRASLDVCVLYDDMTAECVDWKTGKSYASNEDQVGLYALALFLRFKSVTQVTTRLAYVDLGLESIADHKRDDVPALRAVWEARVAPMLTDVEFMARPNDKCRWCAFSKSAGGVCRYG